jgi:hypothetical protein
MSSSMHGELTPWMPHGGWPTPDGWVIDKLVRVETVIALPSVVVSRSLLQKVGGFDEQLLGSEDYDLGAASRWRAKSTPLRACDRGAQTRERALCNARRRSLSLRTPCAEKSLRMRGLEHLSPLPAAARHGA